MTGSDCNCHVPAGNVAPCPRCRLPGVVDQVPLVYACGHSKLYDPPEDDFDAALMDAAAALRCPDCLRLAAEINEHAARIRESGVRLREAFRNG